MIYEETEPTAIFGLWVLLTVVVCWLQIFFSYSLEYNNNVMLTTYLYIEIKLFYMIFLLFFWWEFFARQFEDVADFVFGDI